jgi:hypothetical protein
VPANDPAFPALDTAVAHNDPVVLVLLDAVLALHPVEPHNDPAVPALVAGILVKESGVPALVHGDRINESEDHGMESGELRILRGHRVDESEELRIVREHRVNESGDRINESGNLVMKSGGLRIVRAHPRIVRRKAAILGGYARDVREVTRFEIRPAKMDFRTSGQGIVDVTQLWADDLEIVNALGFVDWEDFPLQLAVCEACGISRCSPGGSVSIRRAGGLVVFLPPFAEMEENEAEYDPSWVLKSEGALVLKEARYRELRDLVPGFPSEASLPALTGKEAARLLQWEAPGRVLGSFPEPVALDRTRLTACSEGDLRQRLDSLSEVLASLQDLAKEIVLRAAGLEEEAVSLFLNDKGFTQWRTLVETSRGVAAFLEPGYVIERP